MKNNDWKNDKAVQNWFQLIGNARTINNYSYDFPKFLNWVVENTPYKTPSEIIQNRVESLTTTDMQKRRFWEQQVIKYKNSLEAQNYRMATVHSSLRTIMSFFAKSGVKLLFSRGELKINPSEKDKVDTEWIPSNEEVRLLYRLCDNARDRAVLLTLYQSGFSEVDVASMQIETFPFYNEKGEWAIPTTEDLYRKQRREKTNQWQQTCISREALEEIRIMLQSRGYPKEGYLFVSFRGEQLGVRGINEALTIVTVKVN
jgi:site-specific recombinase XerC